MAINIFNDIALMARQERDETASFRKAVVEMNAWGSEMRRGTRHAVTAWFAHGLDTVAEYMGVKDVQDIRNDAAGLDPGSSYSVGSVIHEGKKNIYHSAFQIAFSDAVTGRAATDEIHYPRLRRVGETSNAHYLGPPVEQRNWVADTLQKASDYAGLWVIAEQDPDRGPEVTFTIRPYRGCLDRHGTSDANNHLPRKWRGFGPVNTWWSCYDMPLLDKDNGFRQKTYTSPDGSVPQELKDDFLRLYKTGIDRGLFAAPQIVPP